MNITIKAPAQIDAEIQLPASKSISNRVQIINALAYSPYEIQNLSESDDAVVLYNALNSNSTTFDIGPAGTAMRFITAYLSKIVGEWIVTGSERMKNRPIKLLVDALTEIGAKIEYVEKEGYPPLRIFGSKLQGKPIELPGNISSQYISALLMVGPTLEGGLDLTLTGKVISKPYIQMTLDLMQQFGVESEWSGNAIRIKEQEYKAISYFVESDWSAASYWFQIAALSEGAKIILPDLFKESLQGDAKIVEWFARLGVETVYNNNKVMLSTSGNREQCLTIDFINQPDMAQTFAVTCCCLEIPFEFGGLQSLKIKETDRIYALITELRKMGFVLIEPEEGKLAWTGEKCDVSEIISIETYEDHRMAMAFAPAVLTFNNMRIEDAGVVSKSYPRFWEDLQKAGFEINEI